jgi:protein-tyrosine phosphatase
MFLTELPLGLAARVFRSPMPFSHYDLSGEALLEFHQYTISLIVLLAEQDECLCMTRRDLPALYRHAGFHVLHLPIPDCGVPSKAALDEVVTTIIDWAQAGDDIVIHCYAGIGRTGLVAAELAKCILGLSSERAIAWVRQHIPRALEIVEQRRLVIQE